MCYNTYHPQVVTNQCVSDPKLCCAVLRGNKQAVSRGIVSRSVALSALRYARRKALHIRAARAAQRSSQAARHSRGVAKKPHAHPGPHHARARSSPTTSIDTLTQELSRMGVGVATDSVDDMQALLLQLQL